MAEKRLINAEATKKLLRLGFAKGHIMTIQDVEDYIDAVPTQEPKREQQKWTYATDRLYVTVVDGRKLMEPAVKCSGCGAIISESDYLRYIWNFCPVCGAKMEDGTEDE